MNIFKQDEQTTNRIPKKVKLHDNYNPILKTNGEKEEQEVL